MGFNMLVSPHTFPRIDILEQIPRALDNISVAGLIYLLAQNAGQPNNLCQLFRREDGIL